jgi:hypothetical protein
MRIPLTHLPRKLHDCFGVKVSYNKLYQGALNATLPIEPGDNGRYSADEADLSEIVRLLGFARPAGSTRGVQSRRTSASV